ncbi:MAG TPA: GNAT family N-acetyltransferase [Rudaea sp.]
MTVFETDRLRLRELKPDDAPFVYDLVNDPDWLRFIGDRGVRSLDDARQYIAKGPMDMYARIGFGLWLTELKDATPIGICGLLKRDTLDDVDLGFAFLPAYRARGYAYEAAAATIAFGRDTLRLRRIVATTAMDNDASGRLLEKLGFRFERVFQPNGDTRDVKLFAIAL